MKLLMISGDRALASGKQGAFAQMLEEFSKHWERIDIIVPTTLTPNPSPDGRGEKRFGDRMFIHPSPHCLWYQSMWIRKKGLELIDTHHHDVMTVHEYPPFYNGIGARWLKWCRNIPAVLEIHHLVGWPKPASLSEWIGRILSRLVLPSHARAFSAVRVVNRTTKELLMTWGVADEKIQIVPSFYLDHELLMAARGQPKRFDLVFCARIVANKGLFETIDALALVPGVTLLVIGDGPRRPAAEMKVRTLGLQSRVTFTGWLPNEIAVLQAMSSGKIFVMNSRSEGGPRSALEAMALGIPMIATKVGVMPEVIQGGINGLFTTGDAEDLAEKIRSLLSDTGRMVSMGMEASKVIDKFEKRAAIKNYADFLKDVAGYSMATLLHC